MLTYIEGQRNNTIHVEHISGKTNPADCFTKPVDVSIIVPFMANMNT